MRFVEDTQELGRFVENYTTDSATENCSDRTWEWILQTGQLDILISIAVRHWTVLSHYSNWNPTEVAEEEAGSLEFDYTNAVQNIDRRP